MAELALKIIVGLILGIVGLFVILSLIHISSEEVLYQNFMLLDKASISTRAYVVKLMYNIGENLLYPLNLMKGYGPAREFIITSAFSNIPLFTIEPVVHVGNEKHPVDSEKFYNETISTMMDCWNIYGSGNGDPLWGVDPPNPRLCAVKIFNFGDEGVTINFVDLFEKGKKVPNWPFDKKIVFLFLGDSFKGRDYTKWGEKVYSGEVIVYFAYLDSHPYNWPWVYESNLCDGKVQSVFSDNFNSDVRSEDALVLCVKEVNNG